MDGYRTFHSRYWPVLRRLPDPPATILPRLRTLGKPPGYVWRKAYLYLDQLRGRWRM